MEFSKKSCISNFIQNKKKKIYEDEEENFYTEEFITFAKEIQSIVDDLNDIKKTINQKSTEDLQEKIEIVSEVLN